MPPSLENLVLRLEMQQTTMANKKDPHNSANIANVIEAPFAGARATPPAFVTVTVTVVTLVPLTKTVTFAEDCLWSHPGLPLTKQ